MSRYVLSNEIQLKQVHEVSGSLKSSSTGGSRTSGYSASGTGTAGSRTVGCGGTGGSGSRSKDAKLVILFGNVVAVLETLLFSRGDSLAS